jgi:hypothetical protein
MCSNSEEPLPTPPHVLKKFGLDVVDDDNRLHRVRVGENQENGRYAILDPRLPSDRREYLYRVIPLPTARLFWIERVMQECEDVQEYLSRLYNATIAVEDAQDLEWTDPMNPKNPPLDES